MKRNELILFIEDAFNNVLQPIDITLHVANAHDNYDYEHNKEHQKKDFIGRWQDIPINHLETCCYALCHVDKKGILYYLPAYMIWYLKNYDKTDVIDIDFVLYTFDNHVKDLELSNYYKERFSLLNVKQLRACALFVKFSSEFDFMNPFGIDSTFAKKKYDRFWYQYNI